MTRDNPHPASHHGFTLIELLVVIAIVSMLVAILLPTIGRARDTAKRLKCLAQMRQISIGVISYIDVERKTRLFGYQEIVMADIYYQGYFTSHYPKLGEPTQAEHIFHCPSHPWPMTHSNIWMRTSLSSMSSTHYGWPMDYANNRPIMVRTGEPVITAKVPQYARAMLMAETVYDNATRKNRGEGASYFGVYNVTSLAATGAFIPDKHNESGNYAFLDGHAATYRADYVIDHGKADPTSPVRFSWPPGSF